MSFRALGAEIGLSTPATAERVRRLERSGIIEGYAVRLNRASLGRSVTAFLHIGCSGERLRAAQAAAGQSPSVIECHRMAGEETLLLKAAVGDLSELDDLAQRFRLLGPTRVSIVLATAFENGGGR